MSRIHQICKQNTPLKYNFCDWSLYCFLTKYYTVTVIILTVAQTLCNVGSACINFTQSLQDNQGCVSNCTTHSNTNDTMTYNNMQKVY